MWGNGDIEGAITMCQKCLDIKKKALGQDHPEIAETYYNIGSLMKGKGDLEGALLMYQKCLAVREKIF